MTPEDITADAFTFRADAEGITDEELAKCGIQRCADLFLYVADDRVAVTRPIVNLSAQTVTLRGQ